MDQDDQPLLEETEFDAIVVGTGLTESIVAGALARVGRKVLHLDHRQHYGGNRATLDLNSLLQLATASQPSATFTGWQVLTGQVDCPVSEDAAPAESSDLEPAAESTMESGAPASTVGYYKHQDEGFAVTHAEPAEPAAAAPEEAAAAVGLESWKPQSRQFNLDLAPAVLFSNGPLVQSLSRSGVSRYNEFKVVESTNMQIDGVRRKVPCSKNEVFADKQLSLIEKRHLMSFLKTCLQHKADPDTPLKNAGPGVSFVNYLKKNKMPKQLQDVICYALAGLETDQHTDPAPASVAEGLAGISQYLESVGRFNTTAFLCLNYGLGELPQVPTPPASAATHEHPAAPGVLPVVCGVQRYLHPWEGNQ